MQTLLFRVYLKKEVVQVKQFNKDQVVFGKNTDLDVVLSGDAISPIHALVEKRDSGFYLCDLGSEAGVFVQGQKILDAPIRHGDEFVIGPFSIQFYEGLPKPKTPPPGAPQAEQKVVPPTPKPDLAAISATKFAAPDFTKNQFSSPSKGTFLPSSPHKSVSEVVQASSGAVLEVMVCWRERIINTYHFRNKQIITAGFDKTTSVRLPPLSQVLHSIPIIVIGDQVSVLLFPGMQGELHSAQKTIKTFEQLQKEGRISQGADGRSFFLAQKELIKIDIPNTELSLWVRFVPETPVAEMVPWFDFSPTEFTALIVSLVLSLLMYFYAQTFTPPEEVEDETEKIATFVYKDIPKPIAPAVENPVPNAPIPKEEKKSSSTKSDQPVKKEEDTSKTAGKAAEVAPKPPTKEKKPILTSTVKPSKKPGASTNPGGAAVAKEKPTPDVSKLGLFADSGVQKSLEGAKDTGALTQVGSAAAREAGDRGQKPGSGLNVVRTKDGPGGSGIAPIGIKGVGVDAPGGIGKKGGPGIGSGISKGDAKIELGGQEESFGGMDKEAIRRVVREHINDLRTCYETELNRNPDLAGKLILKWEIREGGRVGKVSAENRTDTIKNQRVIKCCESVLREWRFPEPPRGMVGVVVYPFVFQSN